MTQKTLAIVELTFDEYFPVLEGDKEETDWAIDLLRNGDVILHSNEIGDSVGTMRLKELISVNS